MDWGKGDSRVGAVAATANLLHEQAGSNWIDPAIARSFPP